MATILILFVPKILSQRGHQRESIANRDFNNDKVSTIKKRIGLDTDSQKMMNFIAMTLDRGQRIDGAPDNEDSDELNSGLVLRSIGEKDEAPILRSNKRSDTSLIDQPFRPNIDADDDSDQSDFVQDEDSPLTCEKIENKEEELRRRFGLGKTVSTTDGQRDVVGLCD